MQALRLGAHKLPEAEVVLLRTLFRLFAYDKTFCWTLSSEAPYDALVVDANAPEAQSPEFRASVSAVLTLGPASAGDGPDRLARPLRADRLQAWLKSKEASAQEARLTSAQTPGRVAAPVPAPAPAPAETAASKAPSQGSLKLRRWPPASILRNDPMRVRMATLLSRRAMVPRELAAACDQPLAMCQAFMTNLQLMGLLESPAGVAAPTPPPEAVAKASHKTSSGHGAKAVSPSLIKSIRNRLGL